MAEDNVPDGLKDLEARVRQARERTEASGWNKRESGPSAEPANKGMLSLAFRIGTELVAALVVGVGGGVLIDSWLDCRPWGMVIGFVLGAGGGVSNVYRAVNGLGYAVGYQQQPDTAKPPDDASPGPP